MRNKNSFQKELNDRDYLIFHRVASNVKNGEKALFIAARTYYFASKSFHQLQDESLDEAVCWLADSLVEFYTANHSKSHIN